jgi:hypothetical protein
VSVVLQAEGVAEVVHWFIQSRESEPLEESRMSFPGGIPVASDFTPGKKRALALMPPFWNSTARVCWPRPDLGRGAFFF